VRVRSSSRGPLRCQEGERSSRCCGSTNDRRIRIKPSPIFQLPTDARGADSADRDRQGRQIDLGRGALRANAERIRDRRAVAASIGAEVRCSGHSSLKSFGAGRIAIAHESTSIATGTSGSPTGATRPVPRAAEHRDTPPARPPRGGPQVIKFSPDPSSARSAKAASPASSRGGRTERRRRRRARRHLVAEGPRRPEQQRAARERVARISKFIRKGNSQVWGTLVRRRASSHAHALASTRGRMFVADAATCACRFRPETEVPGRGRSSSAASAAIYIDKTTCLRRRLRIERQVLPGNWNTRIRIGSAQDLSGDVLIRITPNPDPGEDDGDTSAAEGVAVAAAAHYGDESDRRQ